MTIIEFPGMTRPTVRPTPPDTPTGAAPPKPTTPPKPKLRPRGVPMGRRTPLFLAALLIVLSLVLFGTVMSLSATAAPSLALGDSAWYLFRSQGAWLLAGLAAMFLMLRIDYQVWRQMSGLLLVIAVVLLAATVFTWAGVSISGARRWLSLWWLTFQPSEAAKLPFIMYAATLLSHPQRPISDPRATVHPVALLTMLYGGLLMLQPHLGASMLIAGTAATMLFFAGASLKRLAFLAGCGVGLVWLMISLTPWRRARLEAFLDPWSDPLDTGYQPLRALHALASGGVGGVGLGAGRSKWGFLPDAHTDFIFAVIGEELGMLGTLFVVLAFVSLAAVGVCIAMRAPDKFGMLLVIGITFSIVLQAGLNIGAALGSFPVVGITLPLLSFGGSSLVSTLAAVGVLLNVARQAH